jgi:N-acyl-D-amino-acid deacylase
MRGEGHHLLKAFDEFLTIIRGAKVRGEIYHLKAASGGWDDFDTVLEGIEQARAEGLQVTADMYTYNASGTGLDAVMPTWVQDGGHKAWVARLKDPEIRRRVAAEMDLPGPVGSPTIELAKNVILTGFRNDALRHLTGKTLAEVAQMRGRSPEDTAMDLVIEDDSSVGVVMFSMTEENVRKGLAKPWVSICSDAGSIAPEGVFLKRQPHPRAYGSFARFLAKYVREEKLVPLPEAIRRMTSLPARNLRIDDARGRLAEGYFADVVIFDPDTIQDHATFAQPHQYATGVHHVFVNGVHVLKNGEHTGATPGRVVYGPGRKK